MYNDLERAVSIAEASSPEVGYDVLLTACKRHIRSQREAEPMTVAGGYVTNEIGQMPNGPCSYPTNKIGAW